MGLNGRENLYIWSVDMTSHSPIKEAIPVSRLWHCKGAYTSFSQDATVNMFEAGVEYRYATIKLAHVDNVPVPAKHWASESIALA